MEKMLGIAASVTAAILGQWLYASYKSGNCASDIGDLRAAYNRHAGTTSRGEIMSGLKKAEEYCRAGDESRAYQVLRRWTEECRDGGGCD